MSYTLIALHMSGARTIGVRLINNENYNIEDVEYRKFIDTINANQVEVTNVAVENGRLKGTNGTLSRYAIIENNLIIGSCPIVILMELADDCYKVVNPLGQIADMHSNDIIKYAKVEGLANGKIVDQNNKEYISSINGEYPKDRLLKAKSTGKRLAVKMKMLDVQEYELDDNYYAKKLPNIDTKDKTLLIGKGCLGISQKGFMNTQYTKIQLPETLDFIGKDAFSGMTSLTELVIPNGVKIIPERMCRNCLELTKVWLPNTIVKIEDMAFLNCNKLKVISCGPRRIQIEPSAIPRKTKLEIRR